VLGAGTAACGDDAGAVRALLRERLATPAAAAVDAGFCPAPSL